MPRGGGTAGGGKKGSGINFHKPSDPSFLKAFKEKVGYKEKVTSIDDKFPSTTEGARAEFEDREDHDDEKPVVVVLGDGDLTAAEVETEMTGTDNNDDAPALPGAKIMFKKPVKRSGSKDQNDTISEEDLVAVSKPKKSKKTKKAKSLLSFDEDEEEESF